MQDYRTTDGDMHLAMIGMSLVARLCLISSVPLQGLRAILVLTLERFQILVDLLSCTVHMGKGALGSLGGDVTSTTHFRYI